MGTPTIRNLDDLVIDRLKAWVRENDARTPQAGGAILRREYRDRCR